MTNDSPVIERIELYPAHVPFREVVRQTMARSSTGLGMAIPAEEAWLGGDFVIARLTSEDGTSGVAEAFVWLPETGVSPAQVIDAVGGGLARYVLGETPFEVERLRRRMRAEELPLAALIPHAHVPRRASGLARVPRPSRRGRSEASAPQAERNLGRHP